MYIAIFPNCSPDVLDLLVLLAEAVLHLGAELGERGVGGVQAGLGVLESVPRVGQLGGERVALALQLDADGGELGDLAGQVLVSALGLTQSV